MSGQTPEIHDPGPRPGESAEQLAAEIRATRRSLAATVEALAARTDVSSRARAELERRRRRLREAIDRMRVRARALLRRLRPR